VYSDFLQNRTYWYEQELLLLKDKIFAHGKPLITLPSVSPDSGVSFRRAAGISPLKDHNKKKLLPIIAKYEHRYPSLKITRNEYEMLDDFLRQTRDRHYKLDKDDVRIVSDIVSGTGVSVDEEFIESIAMHFDNFLEQVAIIFHTAQ
jgi:phosphomannomutase